MCASGTIWGEFMKGRYYFLANKVSAGWLGSPYDYGAVSTNVGCFAVGKGGTSAGWEYQQFKARGLPLRQPRQVDPGAAR